jgi:hypothetical protein
MLLYGIPSVSLTLGMTRHQSGPSFLAMHMK